MFQVIVSLTLLAAAPEAEVRTLSGQSAVGTLQQLSAEQLVIETADGPRTFATKELMGVAFKGHAAAGDVRPKVWLELTDGSRLVGLEYLSQKQEATLTLLDSRPLQIPIRNVSSVRLKEQNDKIAAQWDEVFKSKRTADVVVVRRAEAIDFHEGVLGDVSAEIVDFNLDGDSVQVKRPRVEGLIYFQRAGATLPAAVCELTDRDGARLSVQKLSLTDGTLKLTTTSGLQLDRPLEAIRDIDFSLGKIRYLSDLEPEQMQRTPYIAVVGKPSETDRYYEPRKDRSFDGGPLRLGGQSYAKGLALKSRTLLVYRTAGKYSRFETIAGIDAGVAPLGHVRLTIRGDDKPQPLFEADIAGGDAPLPISLNISGVRKLSIEVDFGQGGDVSDYLDLCEARVIQ